MGDATTSATSVPSADAGLTTSATSVPSADAGLTTSATSVPSADAGLLSAESALERFRAEMRRGEHEPLQRVRQLQSQAASLKERRRPGWQKRVRELEKSIRCQAVAVCRMMQEHGGGLDEAARELGLAPRTLRDWKSRLRLGKLDAACLGRPPKSATAEQGNRVLAFLGDQGPRVGVATLQTAFPELGRAYLSEVQQDYQRCLRRQQRNRLHELTWRHAGAVWAMDFAEPSLVGASWSLPAIEGCYPYLFAVRDLASGFQLCWQPTTDMTEENTVALLSALFAQHGTPLVLKCDNGSGFRAERTKAFLAAVGVIALFSPPRRPGYNGAIEAAIGSLKMRTIEQAASHGRPVHWTSADTEAARDAGNSAPTTVHGPIPAETWTLREALTDEQRQDFKRTVEHARLTIAKARNIDPHIPLNHWRAGIIDRMAIQRALVEHDYLVIRRGNSIRD